jgi:nucleoside-diphosphate-sugar epimerase
MQVLFIGGTGIISTEITNLCVENGWNVTLLNRGVRPKLLRSGRTDSIVCDINDETRVAEFLDDKSFDVVANFINFVPSQVERDLRLFAGKTKQYIFISSASAYQKPLSHYSITESTPLSNPYWEYSRNKIACEELLIEAYRKNGFPVTIVRPSHTYNETAIPLGVHGGKGPWQVLKRMLDGKPVLVHGDGTSLWTLTHSRDFAKGFAGLMGNIHAIGESVQITSDEALTWNQVHYAVADALGVTPRLYHVSSDFISAVDPSFTGPLHGDKAASVLFDNAKLKRLVPGYCPTVRFDTGIRWSVEYYLSHPEMQQPDEEFDRLTELVIASQNAAIASVKKAL